MESSRNKKYPCPVCDTPNQIKEKDSYEICQVCGWEDDDYQKDHPNDIGANKITFNKARKIWKSGKAIYPKTFPRKK